MTTVLVTAASKHGSTAEIADAIATALRAAGLDVRQAEPAQVASLGGIDAVVLGSGVYAGRWLKDARSLVEQFHGAWADLDVWLFSSGPLGSPPEPEEDPVDASEVMDRTGANAHMVFAGKLDRTRLGFGERALVRALRAPEGDFRDWDAISRWAEVIATSLAPSSA